MIQQDFISSIKTAEKQADELIQTARNQAAASIEKSRQEAADISAEARRQAEQKQVHALALVQSQVEEIEKEAAATVELTVEDKIISEAASAVAERIVKYCVDR